MSKQKTRSYWLIMALIIAIAAIPAMVSADVYITPPAIITAPGTYVLNADYTGPGPAIWVDWFPPTDDVVIDGNNHILTGTGPGSGPGIYVSPGCDRVHVKDVTVDNFDYGIFYQGVNGGLIENCDVLNNELVGIVLFASNNIDVRNNRVRLNNGVWNSVGIYSQNCFNNKISDNDVYQNPVGIVSFATAFETITENQVDLSTLDGIWHFGTDAVIDTNEVTNNADGGVVAVWSDDASISHNTIDNNGGLGFFDSGIFVFGSPPLPHAIDATGLIIDDNTVEQNQNGIRLFSFSHDNAVTFNRVNSNTVTGIELVGSLTWYNTIGDNIITNNGVNGVQLRGAPTNIISNNLVENNGQYVFPGPLTGGGIYLTYLGPFNSNNNQILNNTVLQNEPSGIQLEGISPAARVTGVTVDSNLVEDNLDGISLLLSQNNLVVNNTIIDNIWEGMWLSRSTLNTIFNNCFNNTVNVGFDPIIILPNNWNTLITPGPNIVGGKYLGGNYWANPSGTGHSQVTPPNDDEFSNAALFIATGNVDNFPLWNPLSAGIYATPTTGSAPLTVSFYDASYGYPTCWEWDFDDGSPLASTQNVTHTYATNGAYLVTLTVWRCAVDGCAAKSTTDTWIYVGTYANFTATPTVGPVPLMVTFTDLSIGATSWSWSWHKVGGPPGYTPFTQANAKNPIQVFTNDGIYDIKLSVNGPNGPDDEIKTAYIDVRVPLSCDSDFVGAPLTGPKPLTVQFTDLSTNNPIAWTWEYRYPSGSGSWTTFSSLPNPTKQFMDPGLYDIRLTATNLGGGNTESKTGYITVIGPQADFVASPRSGTTALTVYFTDLSTNNPSSWKWYYQNGSGWQQFSTSQDPIFTFSAPGTYDIKLIVDDGQTWADPEEKLGYITVSQIPAPEADFSGSPRTGIKPLRVDFADLSVNNPTSWTWQYKLTSSGSWTTFSSQQHPSFEFATPGIYDVRLTATNDGGPNTNTKSGYITVNNIPAPDVDFTASPRSGIKPLTVDFTDLSGNNPTSWAWDFTNDGTVDNTTQHPTYTYNAVGTYSVKLTATNDGGSSPLIKTSYITVSNIPAPTANFTAVPRSGIKPLTVNFIDQSTGSPTAWAWDFNNDGAVDSTEKNPVYTYNNPGTYTVKLNVSNAGGYNINTMPNYIVVNDIPLPLADFTATPLSAITPVNVAFTDASTGGVTSWLWEFGDGTTSTLQSPTHTFTTPRKYTVSLTVSNVRGQNTKTRVEYIYVKNIPPVANFTAAPTSGTTPLTVQFTDHSTGLAINSWQWNFGDGSTSIIQSPAYIYNTAGTYNVTLTVSNDGGSDGETKYYYINVSSAPPVPPPDVIQLYKGWNFVSVPKKLDNGHDTAIQVFGSVDLDGHAVLMWDAGSELWKQVTATTVLQPLDGYWIYSADPMNINLTFETDPYIQPPKPVYVGWNAIGLTGITPMSARDALTLVGNLDGDWDYLLGYHNGSQADVPIIRDSANPAFSDSRLMYPTHGYWLLMDADGNLRGVV